MSRERTERRAPDPGLEPRSPSVADFPLAVPGASARTRSLNIRQSPALLLFALLAVGACAQGAGPTPEAEGCDLTISFGSYAKGIDGPALAAVRAILADRSVRAVQERKWGREGEITLCARTRRPADAERLFGRICSALPAEPRGPIGVRTASGLSFDSPPRR